MNKEHVIKAAADAGILVQETTYGIFNPERVYSIQPINPHNYSELHPLYHVTLNRTRKELVSGIRLMAERMKIKSPVSA